jgi:hypothetical protein
VYGQPYVVAHAYRKIPNCQKSKQRIAKRITIKDNKGNPITQSFETKGPVCVSGCTTREKLYEDNANRCLLLYIDQSPEQDGRVMDYQRQSSAQTINEVAEEKAVEALQNMQRLLKPVKVCNPFAPLIELPQSIFKPRRTMVLLLSFIEAVTFYHQHQRDKNKEGQVLTTIEDIEWAFKLLKPVLFAKGDELSGACRGFFEQLKTLVKPGESFSGKDIRQKMRVAPSTLRRYLFDLTRYGYLKTTGGSKYKGLEYKVLDYEEYTKLKDGVEGELNKALEKIRKVA